MPADPVCPVCKTVISEDSARATTGQTMHGANEVDPNAGTRSFFNGEWYYFCTLQCRTRFLTAPNSFIES